MKRPAADDPPADPSEQDDPLHALVHRDVNDYSVTPYINWDPRSLLDLESTDAKRRTHCLAEVARLVPLFAVGQRKTVVAALVNRLSVESDSDIKSMIILLIGKFCRYPTVNAPLLLKNLVDQVGQISQEDDAYGVTQLPSTSTKVITNVESADLVSALSERAISDLSDSHYRIRAVAIHLLSALPFILESFIKKLEITPTRKAMSRVEVERVISNYVLDSDPRVRKSALDALVQMHLRGCPLDISLYSLAVNSIRDDHELVRLGGLNLIWTLSTMYPNHRMKLAHDQVEETVPLINDAFVRICDLVNDSSVVIRAKACVIMASYQHVSSDVLSQTFSKQIMSRLRRRVAAKDRNKKSSRKIPIAEGDFDVESDEFHLLDSGACGAFVHGLEDEYQEVRNASIDSICELCMHNEKLVKKATVCLVDMFNDEIDKVRLNAIHSLRKIGISATLEFDVEELDIALGVLEDSDKVAREAAHDLLRVVRLSQKESMNTLIDALITNMKRYPEDQLSIYRCLSDIGKRHDDFIEELVPSLLRLDKRFLVKEANVGDNLFIAKVILIINACTANTNILPTLPKYMFRHFAYFKSKYPDCIPDLRKLYKSVNITLEGDIDCLPMTFSTATERLVESDIQEYVESSSEMLNTIRLQVERSDFDAALLTLGVAVRNFEYIANLKSTFAGKAELTINYLECYQWVIKIKQSHSSPTYASTAQMAAAALFRLSYAIQHTFLGLPTESLHAAIYFRVLGNMVWMFGILKQISISSNSSFNIREILAACIRRLEGIEKEGYHCTALAELKKSLHTAKDSPTTINISTLHSFITAFLPLQGSNMDNHVKRTKATIQSPLPNPDKSHKFFAMFPLKIPVEADITNAADVHDIAVEVILPDQSSMFFWPAPNQFIPVTPYCYKLNTVIEFGLSTWTEAGVVIIRIVRSFEPDLPGLDDYIMSYPNVPKSMSPTRTRKTMSATVISEHLKYKLCPASRTVEY